MRSHHALPRVHAIGHRDVPLRPVTPAEVQLRSQRRKDLLAVAAVLLLVLATAAVIVSYVVQQAPAWRQGQMAGFAPTPAVAAQEAAARSAEPSSPASNMINNIGRVPLILISTAVEMAIFVALGLYLRRDMNRKR